MTDLWAFLLQTLTASGAAALLLAVKALFRDKLSPRWQFGIWGLLAAVLLLPAGRGGRYVLLHWPLWVEAAKSALTGSFSPVRVSAPVPLPPSAPPRDVWELLFLLYAAGAAVLLARYLLLYLRLRQVLRRSDPVPPGQVERVAAQWSLPVCPAVAVPGLPTAFVCGVLRPVLALPAGQTVDDRVILHELLHLRHRDAGWSMLICLLRCLHWCNPLLWFCADQAANDAEALCDQRVLERLEGEQRRVYGQLLLSMASDRYARVPGTSSMANGGRNIRARIQAIARFRRYPAGMALASVCVALVLALPLTLGRRQESVRISGLMHNDTLGFLTAMAWARITPCTGPAGAADAYARAVMTDNGIARALCAPLADHADLAAQMRAAALGPDHWTAEHWESGLPGESAPDGGYYLYNLRRVGEDWTGLLVIPLQWVYLSGPDHPPVTPAPEERAYVACQQLTLRREGERWVALPAEKFRAVRCSQRAERLALLRYGDEALPAAAVYAAQGGGLALEVTVQSVHWTHSQSLRPDAVFDGVQGSVCFTGTPLDGGGRAVRYAAVPVLDGAHPDLSLPAAAPGQGSNSDGCLWGSTSPGETLIKNGGSAGWWDSPADDVTWPSCYLVAFADETGRETGPIPLPLVERGGGA